jgi:hypothetical protein
MGLGRVKTVRWWAWSGERTCGLISEFDYARIAAMSGWIPMMFMTRVRL